jgi:hypothetical protein
MAQVTRVNGDLKPLVNFDAAAYTNTGVNVATSAATVQPQGPKLDFFTYTAAGALTPAELAAGIQTIAQLATVHLYEYTDAAADTLAFAVYPVGAWTTATLDTALQGLGGGWAGGATSASATFTG